MNTKTNAREQRAQRRERLEYCQTASKVASLMSVLLAFGAIIALTGLESWDEGNPTLAIILIVLSLVARLYEVAKDSEIATLEDKLTRI